MPQKKKVSVIIVNYNTSELVLSCIDSIYEKESVDDVEIIVVDNNSQKGDLSLLKNDSRLIFVSSPHNLGFGRANNLGAQYSSGDYLFFLNPDTLLVNDAITILSEYLNNHEEVAIVGANLFDDKYHPTHSFRRIFPGLFSEIDLCVLRCLSKMLFGRNTEYNYSQYPMKVAYITGADLMIKKDVFDNIGGFDSAFFMYYEETDLCYRVKEGGFEIVSCPDASIVHLEGKSFIFSKEREERVQRGRYVYFHKHYGKMYNFLVDVFNIFTLCIASMCFCFHHEKRNKYMNRLKIYINIVSNNE